jgi:hypothetical protein
MPLTRSFALAGLGLCGGGCVVWNRAYQVCVGGWTGRMPIMDRIRRAVIATRRAAVGLAMVTVAGCSTGHAAGSSPPSSPPTLPPPAWSPTPTQAPTLTPGATTRPLPADITTMTVTFLRASDSFSIPPAAILWQRTITRQSLIMQVVAMVDALSATTATQGCTGSLVMLRLDFSSATAHATLDEVSPCARATLVIDGTAGPVLASSLIFQVEQLVGVQATTAANGQPSVTSIR